MRYSDILSEAPIGNFQTYGDLDTEGSYQHADLRAIKSDKWLKKLHNYFSKTPYTFDLILWNRTDAQWKRPNVAPNPSAITFVMSDNEGDERIGLTQWIMAHRVIHGLVLDEQLKNPVLINLFDSIDAVVMRLRGTPEAYQFKSGRETLYTPARESELTVEIMTQFLVRGKVEFSFPETTLFEREPTYENLSKLVYDPRIDGMSNDDVIDLAKRIIDDGEFVGSMNFDGDAKKLSAVVRFESRLKDAVARHKQSFRFVQRMTVVINKGCEKFFDYCVGKVFYLGKHVEPRQIRGEQRSINHRFEITLNMTWRDFGDAASFANNAILVFKDMPEYSAKRVEQYRRHALQFWAEKNAKAEAEPKKMVRAFHFLSSEFDGIDLSSIITDGTMSEFVATFKNHPQNAELYAAYSKINKRLQPALTELIISRQNEGLVAISDERPWIDGDIAFLPTKYIVKVRNSPDPVKKMVSKVSYLLNGKTSRAFNRDALYHPLVIKAAMENGVSALENDGWIKVMYPKLVRDTNKQSALSNEELRALIHKKKNDSGN